ncbi:receiver/sensor box histidine kinase [Haloarcula salina]|uniref:histidine kinase n=1 Tax=Haloarcula salina TaxID=1429914 RepID=A0AA41G416_9EURY|nr:histidine kinase dimerization/phospho-acceptor domain-containing protein [Haloarcula salina]MBV0903196.1 GAF domain-containing protein [Haloarcula salina]
MDSQPTVVFVQSRDDDGAAVSFLRDSGITVHSVDGVRELEYAIEEHGGDCVVTNCEVETDDGTRYLGGLAVVDRLRRTHPELPVILFAEVTNGDIAREAYGRDVFGYVPGTVDDAHQRLLAQVDAAVASRPARQRASKRKQLNEAVRLVNQALVRSDSRLAIEREVATVLAGTSRYTESCTVTVSNGEPVVRALGTQRDRITVTTPDPLVRAVTEERLVVADLDEAAAADETALERGCVRVLVVPLLYEGTSYGALAVYADRIETFDSEEQDSFREVGHNIALAIDASQTKDALQQRTTELEQQKARLTELARIISHELRNPLQAAMGRVEVLESNGDDADITAIERNHARMAFLIDDLMEIARQGERQYTVAPVDLAAVVADAWETIETVDSTLHAECNAPILADYDRLSQLFENFFRLATDRAEDVTVTVADTHRGFVLEHDGPSLGTTDEDAFELRYSSTDEGAGLYLSVIREIARGHDWTVTLSGGPPGRVRIEVGGVAAPSGGGDAESSE